MRRLSLFLIPALAAMAACSVPTGGINVPPPSSIADATVLDEKLALGAEATYAAARTAMEFQVDRGQITGAAATRASALNRKAYAATLAVRSAYDAGNADGYVEAAATATLATSQLLAVLRKEK